jgi:hypothetical protein
VKHIQQPRGFAAGFAAQLAISAVCATMVIDLLLSTTLHYTFIMA